MSKTRMITNMDDSIRFLKNGDLSAYRMNKETAPGWHAAVEELAAKVGVRTPALYRVPTPEINMMALPGDSIIMTDGFLKLSGQTHKSPHPSKETLGVIAHELGHFKQGLGIGLTYRILPFIMPMASMAALYVYDTTVKEKKAITLENIGGAVNQTISNFKIQLRLKKPEAGIAEDERAATITWKENLLETGRYILAGAFGFGAGLAGARAGSRHLEFDADRTAVMLTGDKNGYIHFLKKLSGAAHSQLGETLAKMPRTEGHDTIADHIKLLWKEITVDVFHAHPSIKEREAFLNRSFVDKVLASQAATPHLSL